MKLSDFIRNNKNYGKEISDDDFPAEYLEGIYTSVVEVYFFCTYCVYNWILTVSSLSPGILRKNKSEPWGKVRMDQ